MKRNKGFTLIELLVVIAIIGILSSVVMASLNSARIKGRDVKRLADISQIKTALEMYYDKNSEYPTLDLQPLVADGFLGVVPTGPTGEAYNYVGLETDGACLGYHLYITLEDVNHQALDSDDDYSSLGGTKCDNSNATPLIDGNEVVNAGVYDFHK